jgi:hypothetical protein
MFHAMMRPAEVSGLLRTGCTLPKQGWGPAHLRRLVPGGRKGLHRRRPGPRAPRLKGRPRRAVRKVPIPPRLVTLLRAHIERFGVAPDGRIFRSVNGARLQPSTYWQVWRKVRALSLTPEQLATPLMKRPYDLRHSG